MKKFEIEYELPKVVLLQDSGIGVAEIAGRTCYDSFENSENQDVIDFDDSVSRNLNVNIVKGNVNGVNNIKSSELLDSLAWVHHHHSIIEHASLSYLVKGTSRGVLQEHARHRIQSISVRSTRYTMSGVLNAFVASYSTWDDISLPTAKGQFNELLIGLDMFVITDKRYLQLETDAIYEKLLFQLNMYGEDAFYEQAIAKSSLEFINGVNGTDGLFNKLQEGKKKRNVGDAFKHIVSDNWKVDMVVTFNLRSLKNYFDLRDSGSAYFQIQWLAKAMKEATPVKYLKLIDKEFKDK